MRDGRRVAATSALRELRVELKLRHAELASLERAADILERSIEEHDDRCDTYHPDSACEGVVSARWCRRCGHVIRHCERHGGIRAATHYIGVHLAEQHGGSDVLDPETENARRLSGRGETLPVGGLQTPPAARGSEGATDSEGVEGNDAAAEPGELGTDRRRTSTGPAVIRRSRNREELDR